MAENVVSQSGDQIEIVATSGGAEGASVTYRLGNIQRTEYLCSECESPLVVLEGGVNEYLLGAEDDNIYFYAVVRSCPSHHLLSGIPDHIGGPRVPVVSPQRLDFGTLPRGSNKTMQTVIANMNTSLSMNWNADVGVATWLTVNTSSGTIPPGNHQTITVTADTGSLSRGNHTATLTISSNTGTTTSLITVSVN